MLYKNLIIYYFTLSFYIKASTSFCKIEPLTPLDLYYGHYLSQFPKTKADNKFIYLLNNFFLILLISVILE